MKSFAVLAAASVAAVSAYSDVACPSSEFLKLAPIALSPYLTPCQTAGSWQMLPPTGYPNATQLVAMCKTPACFSLIAAIKAVNPSDCQLVFGSVSLNVKNLTDNFAANCFATTAPAVTTVAP